MPFEIETPEDLRAIECDPVEPGLFRSGKMTPWQVRRLSEYASQTIEWVVQGLIAKATVTMFSGASGAGKSTLLSAIFGKIDRGEPFAGFQTERCPIVVLDRENPLAVVVERHDRLGVTDSETFRVWGGWCEEYPPAADSPALIQWVKDCDPKPVVLFDSVAAFHEGDENNAAEVRKTMHQLRRLADLGATIIVLHHSGKAESAKDFRGSSDFKAAIDIGWHVSSLSGDTARLETLALRTFKARFAVEPNFVLRYVDGQFVCDDRPPKKAVSDVLKEILQANPRLTSAEFESTAIATGISRAQARDFLSSAVKAGKVTVEKGPHNTRYHLWSEGSF